MEIYIMVAILIVALLFVSGMALYHHYENKRWWAVLKLYRDQQEKQYQSLKEILDTLHQHTYILAQIKQSIK